MYEWMKGNVYSMVATFQENNITLNSSASTYFSDIRWVMIGLDFNKKDLAIKPVTKNEIDLGLVDKEQLNKFSIGKGYGRISNKSIMIKVAQLLDKPINGLKCCCEYDEQQNILIVHLNQEV